MSDKKLKIFHGTFHLEQAPLVVLQTDASFNCYGAALQENQYEVHGSFKKGNGVSTSWNCKQ